MPELVIVLALVVVGLVIADEFRRGSVATPMMPRGVEEAAVSAADDRARSDR
jgi:hypothetical protein